MHDALDSAAHLLSQFPLDSLSELWKHIERLHAGESVAFREAVYSRISQLRLAADEVEISPPSAEDLFVRSLSPSPFIAKEVLHNRYCLERRLPNAGQSEAWIATDQKEQKSVVVKTVRIDQPSSTSHRRLAREITALSLLTSAFIVRYRDAFVHSSTGRPCLVIDYIPDAETITAFSKKHKSIRGTIERFISVCRALEEAHARDIFHRDLKPDNILVTEDGFPKVIDFGLSSVADPSEPEAPTLTEDGIGGGSRSYASPEQIMSLRSAGAPSDIFSLGLVLFESLQGHLPYSKTGGMPRFDQVLAQAAQGIPLDVLTDPLIAGSPVDALLVKILAKAIAWKPEDRFWSMREFRDNLEYWLNRDARGNRFAELSRDASPARLLERTLLTQTATRFRRMAIGAAVLLLIAVIAYGALTKTRQLDNERRQRQAAQGALDSLLRSTDPFEGERSFSPTDARRMLDAISPLLGEATTTWQTRLTVANAHNSLGDYELASSVFDALFSDVDQAPAERGSPTNPLKTEILRGWGIALSELGQHTTAEQKLLTAIKLGEEGPCVAATIGGCHEALAILYLSEGNPDRVVAQVALARSYYVDGSPASVAGRSTLAILDAASRSLLNGPASEDWGADINITDALAALEGIVGPDSIEILRAKQAVLGLRVERAIALPNTVDPTPLVKELESSTAAYERLLGMSSDAVADAVCLTSRALSFVGRRDEALALINRCLAARRESKNVNSLAHAQLLIALGSAHLLNGKQVAISDLTEARGIIGTTLGKGSDKYCTVSVSVAFAKYKLGDACDATKEFRGLQEQVQQVFGVDSQQARQLRFHLALSIRECPAEAPHIEEAIGLLESLVDLKAPDDWDNVSFAAVRELVGTHERAGHLERRDYWIRQRDLHPAH